MEISQLFPTSDLTDPKIMLCKTFTTFFKKNLQWYRARPLLLKTRTAGILIFVYVSWICLLLSAFDGCSILQLLQLVLL